MPSFFLFTRGTEEGGAGRRRGSSPAFWATAAAGEKGKGREGHRETIPLHDLGGGGLQGRWPAVAFMAAALRGSAAAGARGKWRGERGKSIPYLGSDRGAARRWGDEGRWVAAWELAAVVLGPGRRHAGDGRVLRRWRASRRAYL